MIGYGQVQGSMAKKSKYKKLRKLILQFIEYNIAGQAFFWSGYLAFFIIYTLLKGDFFVAKIVGNVIGLTVNYIIERYWVFARQNVKKRSREEASRYWILSAVNFGMDVLLVWGLKNIGISPYIGNFISSYFFTFWNYFWYKFWVFPVYRSGHHRSVKIRRRIA